MPVIVVRLLFLILVIAVAGNFNEYNYQGVNAVFLLLLSVAAGTAIILFDILIPQKSLLAFSGAFFGLIVGMVMAYCCALVIDLLVRTYNPSLIEFLKVDSQVLSALVSTTKVLLGIMCCYIAISFILQTKDDVRFIIPYVEFARERKGQHPLILDTSVIIDGRIIDVLSAWHVDVPVIVPRFVLNELQTIADSREKLKRNRGRRGLDVVNRLQAIENIDIQFEDESRAPDDDKGEVDQRLVQLARKLSGRLVTNDFNLNKVAQIRGVDVINLNDLTNALKPIFLPGESLQVRIVKPGEGPDQGIGYLEDGTMVVVEAARDKINDMVTVNVTSVLQRSAGRMVFGKIEGAANKERPRRRNNRPSQA